MARTSASYARSLIFKKSKPAKRFLNASRRQSVGQHRATGRHRRQPARHWWRLVGSIAQSVVRCIAVSLYRCIAVSLISDDAVTQERFYNAVNAPFVGNGITRRVDG
jgi:hypothetical protein